MATRTMTRLRIRAIEIKKLEEKSGRVTAERLLEAAKNPRHPMHKDFQWDNAKAGHQHRLDQARSFIAEVRVIVTRSTREVVCPAYVRDRNVAPLQGYIATRKLISDRESATETLIYEITRAQALFERTQEIAAALDLEHELAALLDATKQFASRIRMKGAPTEIQPVQ